MGTARTRTHPRGKKAVATSRRLGKVLIRQGLVTEDEAGQALRRQRLTGVLVGEILQERGLVTDEQVADALSVSTGLRTAHSAHHHQPVGVQPYPELEGGTATFALRTPTMYGSRR